MPQKSRQHRRGGQRRERRDSTPISTQAAAPEASAAPVAARPGPAPANPAASPLAPMPKRFSATAPVVDYTHIRKELKTLCFIWAPMFAFLIILSFFIH